MTPDLSIVIVSYNVCDLLADCLDSIRTGGVRIASRDTGPQPSVQTEVIVVESGSSDNTADVLRESYPWVTLIEPGRNTGFAGGNNIGIEASRGRYVLILNPDTQPLDGALPAMIDYMDAHSEVGALGPGLLNPDGTIQLSRRRFPTLWTAFCEDTVFMPLAPRRVFDRYFMQDTDETQTVEVDWVQGTALLVRREAIEQVGSFDERFFMYSEEIDWQRRLKAAGWRIVHLPDAQVIHYGGKSSEQVGARRDIYYHTSKASYFDKHHGWAAGQAVRIALLLNFAIKLGIEGAKWLAGHKRPLRRQRVSSYLEVLRSGLRGQG
jgi:N-acetylglucosaminyl-diphospho-decaprenol L-rhamnosyltransferase